MEKKVYGSTAAEAWRKAKAEFGDDAIVLHSSKVKRGGILGFLGKPMIELVVTDDKDFKRAIPRRKPKPKITQALLKKAYESKGDEKQFKLDSKKHVMRDIESASAIRGRLFEDEIGEIKNIVKEIQLQTRHKMLPDYPNELLEVYIHLVNNSVAEQMARGLIRRLQRELTPDEINDRDLVRRKMMECLACLIDVSGPLKIKRKKPHIVALVGPTGVGKTTTVAKLAYTFSEKSRYKTGIITVDQYRIAAVEQLRTYARIMSIPFRSAQTPAELKECVEAFKAQDVILIDTAGRSQRDTAKIDELRSFLKVVEPDETHLVLTCTAQPANIVDIVKNFSVFDFNHVILTKLDEAVDFGLILTVMAKVRAGLSYVTTGQRVPGDIMVGEAEYLAQKIFGECIKND